MISRLMNRTLAIVGFLSLSVGALLEARAQVGPEPVPPEAVPPPVVPTPEPPPAAPAPPPPPASPPPAAVPPPAPAPGYGYAPRPPAAPSIVGIGLRVGAIVPVGEGYAGAPGGGLLLDLSYWYEARYFAIEGRLGVRFDLVKGPSSYVELPIDVAGYFVLGSGGIALFAGRGLGPRHIWETRGEIVGSVIPSTTERSDSGWGLGVFGRIGFLVGRTSRARLAPRPGSRTSGGPRHGSAPISACPPPGTATAS
jgi:hypothetical protein